MLILQRTKLILCNALQVQGHYFIYIEIIMSKVHFIFCSFTHNRISFIKHQSTSLHIEIHTIINQPEKQNLHNSNERNANATYITNNFNLDIYNTKHHYGEKFLNRFHRLRRLYLNSIHSFIHLPRTSLVRSLTHSISSPLWNNIQVKRSRDVVWWYDDDIVYGKRSNGTSKSVRYYTIVS